MSLNLPTFSGQLIYDYKRSANGQPVPGDTKIKKTSPTVDNQHVHTLGREVFAYETPTQIRNNAGVLDLVRYEDGSGKEQYLMHRLHDGKDILTAVLPQEGLIRDFSQNYKSTKGDDGILLESKTQLEVRIDKNTMNGDLFNAFVAQVREKCHQKVKNNYSLNKILDHLNEFDMKTIMTKVLGLIK